MHKIKKDDLVVVIAGKDKDKQGKVISVDTKNDTVLVVDGKATRVGFEVKDGKKVRVAKKTGKVID